MNDTFFVGSANRYLITFSVYLRFPSLRTGTSVFHIYIFHFCKFILTFAVLVFFILMNRAISYSHFHTFVFQYLHFQRPSMHPTHVADSPAVCSYMYFVY